jgi:hypothetical protein
MALSVLNCSILQDSTFNPSFPIPQEMIGMVGVLDPLRGGTLNSVLMTGLQAAGFTTNPLPYAATKRFDSVVAFAKGLHDYLQAGNTFANSTPTCPSCSGDRSASGHGDTLINYLKQVRH